MEEHWPEQLADVNYAVTLRPATDADTEFLYQVFAGTRAEEMALVPWTDAQKEGFLRMQFQAQRQAYGEHFPGAEHSIVVMDGQPVGRVWIARTDEEIRLLDIAILPEHQNSGIGTYLLHQLIAESNQTAKTLRHTVYKFNEGAQRFYERLGFSHAGEAGMYLHMERKPAPLNSPPPPPPPHD